MDPLATTQKPWIPGCAALAQITEGTEKDNCKLKIAKYKFVEKGVTGVNPGSGPGQAPESRVFIGF